MPQHPPPASPPRPLRRTGSRSAAAGSYPGNPGQFGPAAFAGRDRPYPSATAPPRAGLPVRQERNPLTARERPSQAQPRPKSIQSAVPNEPRSTAKATRPHRHPTTKGRRPQVGRAPSRGAPTPNRMAPAPRRSSPRRKARYAEAGQPETHLLEDPGPPGLAQLEAHESHEEEERRRREELPEHLGRDEGGRRD